PPPDVEINKHVSKPESFLGMIEPSAEGTPLAGSPGSNTAVRTRRKALRAQPDQQWFGLGPRKWASKLAVNDPGWNPGEISRKSPALQGWGSNLLEFLLQLPELGHDVNVAVRAAPVIAVVILMVRLGRVEFGQGDELGNDRRAKDAAAGEVLVRLLGRLLLLVVVVENDRAVIGAEVVFLPVQGGRVVSHPEDVEELLVADDRRVIFDLDHLGMAGQTGADHLVGRVRNVSAGVARDHRLHARNPLENRLHAPEAATAKSGLLDLLRLGGIGRVLGLALVLVLFFLRVRPVLLIRARRRILVALVRRGRRFLGLFRSLHHSRQSQNDCDSESCHQKALDHRWTP